MNIDDRTALGKQLAEARKRKGYTQAALAGVLGVSRPHLSSYENGWVEPPFQVLLKAAETLDTEFIAAGYRLTKERLRGREPKRDTVEKQLTFNFYKGRVPKDATIRITTLRRRVIIKARVASVNP
jgi:transcriptional regulator with XRE-family HTH domain